MRIFLDLDGPILDVSEKYYSVYCDLIGEMEGVALSKDKYWELKRNRVNKGKILEESMIFGREEEYSKDRRERIETLDYLKIDSIWPGIPEALDMIGEFFPLYLVTARTNRSGLIWQMQRLGIYDTFTDIISPIEKETSLPRRELKRTMVRRELGNLDLSGWFIGDTDTDTSAGNLLGLNTGVVTYGIRSKEIVTTYGADEVFHTPSEFIDWVRNHLTGTLSS